MRQFGIDKNIENANTILQAGNKKIFTLTIIGIIRLYTYVVHLNVHVDGKLSSCVCS